MTTAIKDMDIWAMNPPKELSPMEKELLSAMAENQGQLCILRRNDGEWIRIGSQDFWDTEQDPRRRVRALEARACLLKRGYLWYAGNAETLTPKGKKVAERLRAETPTRR